MFAALLVSSVVVSLNPCFDNWLPQWLDASVKIVPTTAHGGRLEAVLHYEPDTVLAGSFVNRSLRLALETHAPLVTMPYVTDWAQWQAALVQLGQELDQKSSLATWAQQQQRQLAAHDLSGLGEVLVLMPNAYTWGQESWIADLLQRHHAQLSPLMGAGQLLRLSLEQVLMSTPDTVILEGFSTSYARAHDWLWHSAMQEWLTARQVVEVPSAIAGCSDIRANEYLLQLNGGTGV